MNTELIALAETLDAARIAANAIEAAAPQNGVYGHAERALTATLELITGTEERAAVVYQSILDGNTVTQGLAWELASREPEAEELRIGDKIRFILGETPILGTVLFAVGTGIAVRLESGSEIIINPDTITRPSIR